VGHREGLRKSPMARVEQLQFDRASDLGSVNLLGIGVVETFRVALKSESQLS
jgi:hypothetical protein